ncbi:hypothetical protein IBL28_13120 [Sinomicrobium sp. FJxs]|uniref:Uncharacterized protein n=2 Tax=Sinomicrobium weinanense TaxID=2842200 RepID=A0A926Q4I1_9FLAO|nr:hypothetical protein [Sinomicrobium weinanense]MBU3124223.1 hypothetical protein [Sinomicrobium weinanense]
MGFLAVYFILSFLLLGIGLYPLLAELYPGIEPLASVNRLVVYWLGADLLARFFIQALPVIGIKSLLILPVPKRKVVHYLLLRSLFSFFNLFPLLVIVPFGIYGVMHGGYNPVRILAWGVCMMSLVVGVNYFNLLVKKRFAGKIRTFLPFIVVGVVLVVLEYLGILQLGIWTGALLDSLVAHPYLAVVSLCIPVFLYWWNYRELHHHFYLDASLESSKEQTRTSEMGWVRRFGDIAPFLQLDLKLIWRNKRPRSTVWLALLFVAYGLMIYPNPSNQDMPGWYVFVGVFISGVFMMNFGQFVPAWDSSYYSMMMAQNIPLKKYLSSKAALMTFSVVVLYLLSLPYVYFGWDILVLNTACALYNIGINIPVLLYTGGYNKKRIELDKSPFLNYQGTGAVQFIMILPLLILPVLIWYLCYKFISFDAASSVLALIGIAGIMARDGLMARIVSLYRKKKYVAINGFKERND